MSEFCSLLVADFHSSIPKTGVVSVNCKVDTWKEISEEKGEVGLFDFPANKMKKSDITKKFQIGLGENIDAQLKLLLKAIEPEVAKKMKPAVKKTSTKMAKRFVKAAEDYGDKALLFKITENYCSKVKIKEEEFKKVELVKPDLNSHELAQKGASVANKEKTEAAKPKPPPRPKTTIKAKRSTRKPSTRKPAIKKKITRTAKSTAPK